MQTALQAVGDSLQEVKEQRVVTWIMDTGFGDVAVWCTICEQEEHLVCRVKHAERRIEYLDDKDRWVGGTSRVARDQMYRQRWAAEDSFRFFKDILGWEDVQLLDLRGIRTLVALRWVAAGFLYELGVTLQWEELRLLAGLGGWADFAKLSLSLSLSI